MASLAITARSFLLFFFLFKWTVFVEMIEVSHCKVNLQQLLIRDIYQLDAIFCLPTYSIKALKVS